MMGAEELFETATHLTTVRALIEAAAALDEPTLDELAEAWKPILEAYRDYST